MELQSLSIQQLRELKVQQYRELKTLTPLSEPFFEKLYELKATTDYLSFVSNPVENDTVFND